MPILRLPCSRPFAALRQTNARGIIHQNQNCASFQFISMSDAKPMTTVAKKSATTRTNSTATCLALTVTVMQCLDHVSSFLDSAAPNDPCSCLLRRCRKQTRTARKEAKQKAYPSLPGYVYHWTCLWQEMPSVVWNFTLGIRAAWKP